MLGRPKHSKIEVVVPKEEQVEGVDHCTYLQEIKQIVVIIEAYCFCQLHTLCLPTSCCQD